MPQPPREVLTLVALDPHKAKLMPRFSMSQWTSSRSAGTF